MRVGGKSGVVSAAAYSEAAHRAGQGTVVDEAVVRGEGEFDGVAGRERSAVWHAEVIGHVCLVCHVGGGSD